MPPVGTPLPLPDFMGANANPITAERRREADRRQGDEGTTDQRPRWEGPPENRPRGYLPAVDDPARDKDAAGESLSDPVKSDLSDAFKSKTPKKPGLRGA